MDDLGVVIYIVLFVLFAVGGLIRKLIEKKAEGGGGGAGRPRPQRQDAGREIKDFLEKLGRELGGEKAPRPPQPEPARPAPPPARPARRRPPGRPPRRVPEQPRTVSPLLTVPQSPPPESALVAEGRRAGSSRVGPHVGRPRRRPVRIRSAPDLPFGGIHPDRLREAVVWAEILGKPRCMKRWVAR